MENIISALKELPLKTRFAAFIIAIILITTPAILTSYLKTNDCKGISDQYITLVENQSKLMNINNTLIENNNSKTNDLIKIQELLGKINNKNKTSDVTVYEDEPERKMVSKMITKSTYDDSSLLMSSAPAPKLIPLNRSRLRIIKRAPEGQKILLDSI